MSLSNPFKIVRVSYHNRIFRFLEFFLHRPFLLGVPFVDFYRAEFSEFIFYFPPPPAPGQFSTGQLIFAGGAAKIQTISRATPGRKIFELFSKGVVDGEGERVRWKTNCGKYSGFYYYRGGFSTVSGDNAPRKKDRRFVRCFVFLFRSFSKPINFPSGNLFYLISLNRISFPIAAVPRSGCGPSRARGGWKGVRRIRSRAIICPESF